MDVTEQRSGQLLDLSADQCWALVASQPVGRLAWIGPQGVTLVPVNYLTIDRRVHVRTAAYSALARECDDSDVAFQVDELDAEHRSGWSVLMHGRAHLQFGGSGAGDRPDVWPAGSRGLEITIDVEQISGRRLA